MGSEGRSRDPQRPIVCFAIRLPAASSFSELEVDKRAPGHTIYPYLLRKLPITRANHVWAMDITYIPMARGFVYLAAVIDWHSRCVLAWRLSISMDTALCTQAVEEASAKCARSNTRRSKDTAKLCPQFRAFTS